MPDRLEFCPRCGSGPRGNDPNASPNECPDCGRRWPDAAPEPTRYGFGLRRVRWPFWRFDATRTAFDLHVFVGNWWISVPFFRHPLAK